jgi:hypothetical protein
MSKIYTVLYDENSPELDLNTWYASKGDPVLPNYKTNSSLLQWMTGAANEKVGSMTASPNVDISASQIILTNDLEWDIENQLVVFARQKLIFDGNGKTITLIKTGGTITRCYGIITAPHQFSYRGWNDRLDDGYKGQYTYYRNDRSQWFDHIKDIDSNNNLVEIPENEDPYGIHIKNIIVNAETNDIDLQNGAGYLFGLINRSTNDTHQSYLTYYGGGGRSMVNGNITENTKNTFIVEKCQIITKKSTIDSNTSSGSFVGSLSGRAKFLNCISNHRFFGYQTYGWIEVENCFINSDEEFTSDNLNRQQDFEARNPDTTAVAILYPASDPADKSHKAYHKYIFKNCVAKTLYKQFSQYWSASTTNGTNPNVTGTLLEVTNCKVYDSTLYKTLRSGVENSTSISTYTNNTTNFAYLSGSSVDTSKLDDILAVINSDNSFKKENNEINLQFSPLIGISMNDYLSVKSIDLSASNIISSSSIPATWFNNLNVDETIAKRRNLLISEIFTNNTSVTSFDISKNAINLSVNAIKETCKVFKIDTNTNSVDVNFNTNTNLNNKTGFYVPMSNNNEKVNITNKDGTITFKIERTGTDVNGKAEYQITKMSGTDTILINA